MTRIDGDSFAGPLSLFWATLLLGGAIVVALLASDAVLLAATVCAAGGLVLLGVERPRPARSGARPRRRVRVRKAARVEGLIGEAEGAPPSAHPAA